MESVSDPDDAPSEVACVGDVAHLVSSWIRRRHVGCRVAYAPVGVGRLATVMCLTTMGCGLPAGYVPALYRPIGSLTSVGRGIPPDGQLSCSLPDIVAHISRVNDVVSHVYRLRR